VTQSGRVAPHESCGHQADARTKPKESKAKAFVVGADCRVQTGGEPDSCHQAADKRNETTKEG
jgi:hypothetical protein